MKIKVAKFAKPMTVKVLVVDDNAEVAASIGIVLASLGCEAATEFSAQDGISWANELRL